MGLLDRIRARFGSPAVQACVPPLARVVIVVSRSDDGQPVAGAATTLTGPTPGSGATDDLGARIFEGRSPGAYSAAVTLPGPLGAFRITQQTTAGSVGAGGTLILPWMAAPVGKLALEVYDDHGSIVTEQAQFAATGAATLGHAVTTGSHTFDDISPGGYDVAVTVPATLFEVATVSASAVQVPVGGTGSKRLVVKRLINVVTPKIEMEYRVVVLDRKLSAHQDASEARLVTDDVTCIHISAQQTTGVPYAGGGTFEVSPANVEVFTDEACTRKLADRKLTNAEIARGAPFVLYLKGKTKGKFTAKLTLDPSTSPYVQVQGPASEEMGVVELESTLHRFDKGELDALEVDPANDPIATYHTRLKAKALPAQKALTDAQKVKEGRLLHVQSGKHHGRAKLVVKKLVADQWPAGTDDYDIVLGNEGGALTLFDNEEEGTEKPIPHKLKVKDLKAADLELWVAGKAESAKVRDAVLDIGLDRGPGGLAKTAKKNADWGRFTVVKIDKVELVVAVPAGKPKVWDDASSRYYINTEAGAAGRTLGDRAGEREVKVVATLSKKIADVPLHFMLAPHADNAAPAGLPASWKPETLKVDMRRLDRKDRKALLHFSDRTDADGKVEMKQLVLSAFGGDRFTPAAYIEQDPHLAKYVPGHADLGQRVPTLCARTLQVWKHFHYRIVYMKRHDGTSYSNRFTEASLHAKFEADFIEMERNGAVVEADHEDMVPYDTARDWVIGKLGAEKPRQLQFAFVDAIGKTPEIEHELSTVGLPGLSFNWPIGGGQCFDMSSQAKWLTSASYKVGADPALPIAGANLSLNHDGPNHQLSVDLSGIAALASVDLATIAVTIKLIKHDFPSGLSWGAPTLVGMRWREAGFPGQESEATMRTAYHEAGHYLGLAPKTLPDAGATASTQWYNTPGVGNHCNFGPQDCTLWHSFIMKIEFCPTCRLALRARDHAGQVNADTPF